ncbi:hypothetical protein G9C98_001503 [Cotesia typhae]|uniref:Sugar phosphate phosphatase n=1 Tax=Cotesia typhae TaxID=2053667 RepID=A0A8J5R5G6_9HYME|nr:hypothetical protein G9C98_001503 [Cotesia typhae]
MEIQNLNTPFGEFLSGKYEKSFAYKTIKDRLPVIITSIIDNISQCKDSIITKYGLNCSEELKQVIGQLSELKSEMMTNKPLKFIDSSDNGKEDISKWNECIKNQQFQNENLLTWYNSVWLFSECYMYRRVAHIFLSTATLFTYDYFEKQKHDNFTTSLETISVLANYTMKVLNESKSNLIENQKNCFTTLLKSTLWGNKCDLSLSQGSAVKIEDMVDQTKTLDENILIDHSDLIWTRLNHFHADYKDTTIDIVLDNAGYELFTDFCIAAFLIENDFAKKIRFHVKSIPWFVSDVTERDLFWTIDTMKNSNHKNLMKLGHRCSKYLEDNKWTVEIESFWTEPYDFSQMKVESLQLYNKLSEAILIIFKGDLNYRKLMGDINWDYETDLKTALRGFQPTNIVALRTVKADLIVGVPHKKVNELFSKQENWMETGQYGLIHSYFVDNNL